MKRKDSTKMIPMDLPGCSIEEIRAAFALQQCSPWEVGFLKYRLTSNTVQDMTQEEAVQVNS